MSVSFCLQRTARPGMRQGAADMAVKKDREDRTAGRAPEFGARPFRAAEPHR